MIALLKKHYNGILFWIGVLSVITGVVWLYKIDSIESATACAGIVQGYWLINLVTEDENNSKVNKENKNI